ncbi:HAMP domain-containing protein [Brevibacillus laterosporus]|uniref:histidine kinase n=1 Tax=Brevibacillus laterosporus TaxID=1465 RepID=A0A518V5E3_BRELA|nr:HAMP domain-containing sensor histidine kinase [Brevibacillus laterosporus]QDX92199.1 HAMP domain-containing protein [Brevibacillus laterosporus]TPG70499.1 HAMP domain-containing protein [Brevibacillus laterosporus]
MKSSIVLKLFIWTTTLCLFILASIYVGQTVFFKQFYINKKVADVQANLETFAQEYGKNSGDAQAIQRLEQEYYRQHNTWITTVDYLGNINHADDISIEVKLLPDKDSPFSNQTLIIPLYGFLNIEEIHQGNSFLHTGAMVTIQGIKKDTAVVPYRLGVEWGKVSFENNQIAKKEHEMIPKFQDQKKSLKDFPSIYLFGTITKTHLPVKNETPRLLYTNLVFMDRIKEFQANLLLSPEKMELTIPWTYLVEENDIKYQLFVHPIQNKDGKPAYIFAMTSLQPVDEAISMIKEYYVYLILFVLLLILLSSFYYSKQIARPLLRINHTTKKIATLDFSEKIHVESKDEIGDLSHNINVLSDRLHSYIEQLQQDIEKEKQLENTRKEFISGVSHELKTPLSVIQSCLSILKDGVASHKKDYYFDAMENEVKKMDMLIVDMLDLAKYESGTYKMKMELFPLDVVIKQICEKVRPEIESKQLHLHTELVPIKVVANQLRIEQVLVNFLTNAIRYTPDGETIMISISEEQDMAIVCIENKGVHIQEEHLEKIWDRFYRGESSRHRSTGGTGLGLAISKKILELHDVPYGVFNTEDGVMFYFHLPK